MSNKNENFEDFESELKSYSKISEGALDKSRGAGVALSSVAALAVCTTESEAAVVITDVNSIVNDGTTVMLDVNGDMTVDFAFEATATGFSQNVRLDASSGAEVVGRANGGYRYASRLVLSANVGPANSFVLATEPTKFLAVATGSGYSGGDWLNGATGFIGFSVPNGTDVNYGWIEVAVNADSVSGTVLRYGLETVVNTPVLAGVASVPEPNSLACLAMGAAGLLGWRQRRKTA